MTASMMSSSLALSLKFSLSDALPLLSLARFRSELDDVMSKRPVSITFQMTTSLDGFKQADDTLSSDKHSADCAVFRNTSH
jgi:hypothetical protein